MSEQSGKKFMLPDCFFLPRQTIKNEAFFSMVTCLAFKQHRPKNSCKPADFRKT